MGKVFKVRCTTLCGLRCLTLCGLRRLALCLGRFPAGGMRLCGPSGARAAAPRRNRARSLSPAGL